MIDLTRARHVLSSAKELLDDLDGVDLDDSNAIYAQGQSNIRQERAQASKDLLQLADQLDLAGQLVRNAYWSFRGEPDPLEDAG